MVSYRTKAKVSQAAFWVCLVIAFIWVIHPLIWMIFSSIEPEAQIFSRGLTLPDPRTVSLDAYFWVTGLGQFMNPSNPFRMTVGTFKFWGYLANGLVPGLISAAIVAVCSLFAGYSLGRYKESGVQTIGVFYLSLQFMPAILFFVPWYIMFNDFALLDSWAALICIYVATSLPWSVWTMRSFIVNMPKDIEEAGLIDGCSRFQIIYKIILPLTAPGVVAVSLFAFTSAWGAYLPGLIISSTMASTPISVGLAQMLTWYGRTYFGGLMAASVLTTLPVAIAFVYLQKWMVQGLSAGAVKA
jgi:ABC-type glycerol-3-phosphate transport system permease component